MVNYMNKTYQLHCLFESDCGPITSPTDGSVDSSEGTVYLSVAVFECNLGYTMAGSETSMCEATADWSDPTPDCNINGKTFYKCSFLFLEKNTHNICIFSRNWVKAKNTTAQRSSKT